MTNQSKLNNFKAAELSQKHQEGVQGGNYQALIEGLNKKLEKLQEEYYSLSKNKRKKGKSTFLEKEDVIKCTIEQLVSLNDGGNGNGLW